MKIKIQHPRVLRDDKGFSKHFAPGVHEISEDVAKHWYTAHEMEAGNVTVMVEQKKAPKSDADGDGDGEAGKGKAKDKGTDKSK